MTSKRPAISIRGTREQLAAAEKLRLKLGMTSVADVGRRLFEDACKAHGIDWPADAVQWGGARQRPKKDA